MSLLIVHLVPQLPPAVCGLGDYATAVGRKIEELYPDMRCAYLACGHRTAAQPATTMHAVDATGSCDLERFWQAADQLAESFAVDDITLLLHYSGYGYDPGGAPSWLADALDVRPPRFAKSKLITFFHELYATGRPWERAFWNSARQRVVATRIARASDELMTNRALSARWLEAVARREIGSTLHLPVPSNVGESVSVLPIESRSPHALLFGGARFKRPFLVGRGARQTAALCRKLQISKIVDIGQDGDCTVAPFDGAGIEIHRTGVLPPDDVRTWMQNARVGLVYYPIHVFEKSGVIAATAAHGLGFVVPRAMTPLPFASVFLEDVSYFTGRSSEHWHLRLKESAASACQWYRMHDLRKHADTLAAQMKCGGRTELHGGVPSISRDTAMKLTTQ